MTPMVKKFMVCGLIMLLVVTLAICGRMYRLSGSITAVDGTSKKVLLFVLTRGLLKGKQIAMVTGEALCGPIVKALLR